MHKLTHGKVDGGAPAMVIGVAVMLRRGKAWHGGLSSMVSEHGRMRLKGPCVVLVIE